MLKEVLHIAKTIKETIINKPEKGIDLLLEFTRKYAVNIEIEDDILMLKYQIVTNLNLEGEHLDVLKGKLINILEFVVSNYDNIKLSERLGNEIKLSERTKSIAVNEKVVLTAENLCKKYPKSNFTLQTSELEFKTGQITGVVGENATGKSTLLKILAGEIALDKGILRYPIFDPSRKFNWSNIKMQIAYVASEPSEIRGSLVENLHYSAAIHGICGKENMKNVTYIIQRLGLSLHINKSWHELSTGYKLRYSLAKELVWNPKLLILDEPLANLDIKTKRAFLIDLQNLSKSLKNPLAIVLSSQDIQEVEGIANQMLLLQNGIVSKADDLESTNFNLLEFKCNESYANVIKCLNDINFKKCWQDGNHFFLSLPTETNPMQVLKIINENNISIDFYNNLSNSIVKRFYIDEI